MNVRQRQIQEVVCLIPSYSSVEKVISFVEGSHDVRWEMAILLHEFGHWRCGHPELSNVNFQVAYQQEIEAWEVGREIGVSCGVVDFTIFNRVREQALESYRNGLSIPFLSQSKDSV